MRTKCPQLVLHTRAAAIVGDRDEISLQVFAGGKGLSTEATVRFLGHSTRVTCSATTPGRVFRGDGRPIDGGPELAGDHRSDGTVA